MEIIESLQVCLRFIDLSNLDVSMPSDNTDWWLPVEWIVAGIWIWKAWLKQYLIWSFDLPREENPSFPSVLFSPSSLWWPKLHTLRGSCQTQQGDDQQVQKMLKLCSVMVRAGAGTQADIRADSRLDWTHTHTHLMSWERSFKWSQLSPCYPHGFCVFIYDIPKCFDWNSMATSDPSINHSPFILCGDQLYTEFSVMHI